MLRSEKNVHQRLVLGVFTQPAEKEVEKKTDDKKEQKEQNQ